MELISLSAGCAALRLGYRKTNRRKSWNRTTKPPYYAVGFRSEKSDKTYRYVWLYKVRAKPVTENYATKEGKTVTRQTGEVEWTAIKRTHDGRYQAVADEGQNGFTSEKAAAFLSSVYEPSFTPIGT